MTDERPRRPQQHSNALLDTAEDAARGVGRFGYGLLSLGLGLLPKQSREHMHNAVRELSYAFASLPRDFAEVAGNEVERWAAGPAEPAPRVQHITVTDESAIAAQPAYEAPLGAPAPVAPAPPSVAAPPAPIAAASAPAQPAPAPTPIRAAAPTPPAPAPAQPAPAPTPIRAAAPTPPAPVPTQPAPAPTPIRAAAPTPPAPAPTQPAPAPTPIRAAAPTPPTSAAAAARITIAHIEYNPPGRDRDGEYVLLRNNTAEPVDMTGWKLSDSGARHSFTFPGFKLAPGAEVKLWTRAGMANATNLYWANRSAIWNNTGDTATLKDAKGELVSSYSYQGKGKK